MLFALAAACSSGDGPSDPPQAALRGSLEVSIHGLPLEAVASVTVTGPGGYSRTITGTTTLTSLAAGNYTVSVADVTHNGSEFKGAPSSYVVAVSYGASVAAPGVFYTIRTGSLSLALSGLPAATPGEVVVSGPDGYSRTVTGPLSIVGLKPGTYSIEARQVLLSNATYAATPGTQVVEVSASTTPSLAQVSYALASGVLEIAISGLPDGTNGSLTVSGPAGFSTAVTGNVKLENLTPGLYTLSATNVQSGSLFIPSPASQQINVAASPDPVAVSVQYASAGTSLMIEVFGVPTGLTGAISVAGPNGYATQVTGTQLLSGIQAGSYTITAAPLNTACSVMSPTPASQAVMVTAGQGTTATVSYSSSAASLNLCIDGAYITQAVQSYANSVPLVAGRDGLLRVFVRASGNNTATPNVRVRFYSGNTLVTTIVIPPPLGSVPAAVDEATLNSSWNTSIAGSLLQPGISVLVDVDPTNQVAEANEADNAFPLDGSPAALDIRAVASMNVRLVPVIQAARGDTGRISDANKSNFIAPAMKMFPVADLDADVREPYTYAGAELQSGGTNWSGLLSELNAVRVAEASGRMYYGVVRVGYTSGVAGLGYIGVPTAIGWDYPSSGPGVMAHEFGHNFARLHSPCGGPSGVDTQYPYAGAQIGVFGYDVVAGVIKFPVLRDLMSYCDPAWISDYTYKAIMNFRAANPMVSAAQVGASERGLLVWGRLDRGRLVLEPGFEVNAPASLPTRGGPHRIEGFGARGETLFALSFSGDRVADSADPTEETFAFVIPMSQLQGVELDRLRLSTAGRQVERQRSTSVGAAPTAVRMASGRVRVSWNAASAPAALVRDARTGRIVSIARGGALDLQTASDDLEITLSDGVRSVKSKVRPR
jgi:hypothetical protein